MLRLRTHRLRPARLVLAFLAIALLMSKQAAADIVQAEPVAPIVAPFPAGAPPLETQVVLQVVVDREGHVESAVEASRLPRDAPDVFVRAAVDAALAARFEPSTRDGHPIRSRIEYVVVFHPPAAPNGVPSPAASSAPVAPAGAAPSRGPAAGSAPALPSPSPPPSSSSGAPQGGETVQVHGVVWPSPRGLGDVRIDREILTASPRAQTSEMLSAAPGFFVDHDDGEGLGNDVYLRGFDLDNGSGIEMTLDEIPLNVPLHIHGQGYADVNFIIPEVVRSIRVIEGPYDPRQGDAAIVGTAQFDLGVPERGYILKSTYGSFGQARVVGIAAPKEANDETFAAFSLRETQGFGQDRAGQSASVNAQYGVDLTDSDHLRVVATAYAASNALPGVVRMDDVSAGRIGYYDAYPHYNSFYPDNCSSASCAQPAQGVETARVIVGAELSHTTGAGARFEIAPWIMWTDFLSRQNYTGEMETSNLQPQLPSLGDLWQLTNVETAAGFTTRFHAAPVRLGEQVEMAIEPGVSLRAGHTEQTKNLVDPADLTPWDKRLDDGLDTLDLAGYVDLDVRIAKRLRLSGGVRADFLNVTIDDRLAGVVPPVPTGALAGSVTNVAGVAPGPRGTVSYDLAAGLTPVVSAGQGFRSLDAGSLTLCNSRAIAMGGPGTQLPPCTPGSPYSRVTSFEAGFKSNIAKGRYATTLSAFQTNVENELVFEASTGGLATQRASTRKGIVGSFVARPTGWLLGSTALSLQTATFDTLVAGSSHFVPSVPSVLWRTDINVHGELFRFRDAPVTGRVGVGYTLFGGRHLTDAIVGPTKHILNALAYARYRFVEVGLDLFNALGLKYPDDEEYFVSNWSVKPGQQPASNAVHVVAAPPRTILATMTVYF